MKFGLEGLKGLKKETGPNREDILPDNVFFDLIKQDSALLNAVQALESEVELDIEDGMVAEVIKGKNFSTLVRPVQQRLDELNRRVTEDAIFGAMEAWNTRGTNLN